MPDFLAILEAETAAGDPGDTGFAWSSVAGGRLGILTERWRPIGKSWLVAGRLVVRDQGGEPRADLLNKLLDSKSARSAYNDLSGMFILVHRSGDAFTVVTDRFNHLPVYTLGTGGKRIVASRPELVAAAAPTPPEIDEVSVAEILLWENVTYPYTTRIGVTQLAPGSVHTFVPGGIHHEESLWVPEEPDKWPSLRAAVDCTVGAAEEAAREIASCASSAAVLLSGGLDSRIIAAALKSVMEVRAITFMDRPNQETRAAMATSEVLGIEHELVRRDPDFYARAFDLGQELAGFEQDSMPCHTATLLGKRAARKGEVFVSGFGCDILLKGAYIPYSFGTVLKQRYLGTQPGPHRIGKHNYSHVGERAKLIKPELVAAAKERRQAHENRLRMFRPCSAEEWVGFYPISHTTSVDTMVAARLMPYDEFFFHTGFVEAMAKTRWVHKKGLGLVTRLGLRAGAEVARLKHPQTGLPATTPYLRRRLLTKLGMSRPAPCVSPEPGDPSWYSQSSFVNYGAFIKDSPAWAVTQEEAFADPDAVASLAKIMVIDPRMFEIARPEHNLARDPLLHATIVQALRLFRLTDHGLEGRA